VKVVDSSLEMEQCFLLTLTFCYVCLVTGSPQDGFTFDAQNQDVTVDAGTQIKLACTFEDVSADLLNTLEWVKLGNTDKVISRGDKIVSDEYAARGDVSMDGDESVLTIERAEDGDAGQYQCMLERGELVEKIRYNVVLRGTPLIQSVTPSILTASPGDDITLTCTTSGSYPATVRWTRPGSTLPGGEDEMLADVLRIDDVKAGDSGSYQCTAVDDRGRSARRLVKVVVLTQEEDGLVSAAGNIYLGVFTFLVIEFGRHFVDIC